LSGDLLRSPWIFCFVIVFLTGCQQIIPQQLDPTQIEKVKVLNVSEELGNTDKADILVKIVIESRLSSALPLNTSLSDAGLYMNYVKVGRVMSIKPSQLMPERESQFKILIKIDDEKIPEWWRSHIEDNETTNVILRSDLAFNLGEALLRVLHQNQCEFRTNFLKNLSYTNKIVKSRNESLLVSVISEWGNVTPNSTEIIHRVSILNPTTKSFLIRNFECESYLNSAKLVDDNLCKILDVRKPSSISLPFYLEPSSETGIIIVQYINTSILKKWWASHLLESNTSSFRCRIVLNAVVNGDVANFILLDTTYEFKTDIWRCLVG
jgi:LEA14-like dessication related protein